ncbi:MAG: hypothetical protein LKE53_04710 [Oscillospiraceae bacterium]|nr:hypothetical protein [Oscillospiraceae bacterium]
MQEGKQILWRVRVIVCAAALATALGLRYGVGGHAYSVSKAWYTQQMQKSVLPNLSAENLQKKFYDILPKASLTTSSQGKSASAASSSAKGTGSAASSKR